MTLDVTHIWTEFQAELKRFILNKTGNKADTEDILQEVFLKIIRHIDKVNDAENLRKYLYGIVRNTINDHFRKNRNTITGSALQDELTQEEEHNLNETIAACCIKPFIDQLPQKYKEALTLAEFQNISQKDLARKLEISYSGAKSRVQRGRKKLKEFILDCCAYESDSYGNLLEPESKNCNCS
jgi:RNA polymerase sigma-70 factor (ECF subfamily)